MPLQLAWIPDPDIYTGSSFASVGVRHRHRLRRRSQILSELISSFAFSSLCCLWLLFIYSVSFAEAVAVAVAFALDFAFAQLI